MQPGKTPEGGSRGRKGCVTVFLQLKKEGLPVCRMVKQINDVEV